jgi:hypothetical protein
MISINIQPGLLRSLLALSLLATAAQANDDADADRNLSGVYRFTTSETCVRSPFLAPQTAAFEPSSRQLQVDGETVSALGGGLLRFSRNGTVTLEEGRQTEISTGRVGAGTTPVAPPSQFTCSGTHRLEGNKLVMSLACDVKQASPVVKVALGPLNLEGYLGLTPLAIDMVNAGGDIQTISVSVNGNVVQQRQRICNQAISLTRVLR